MKSHTLRLVSFVMMDHFLNDEVEEFLGKFGVQIGPVCKVFQPRNLRGFARGVACWQVMFCLQLAHGLGVFEPLAQCVDEDGIEAVDALAVLFEDLGGFDDGISQWASLSV